MLKIEKRVQDAYEIAKDSRLNAHAIYSNFFVGACLSLRNGELIPGCNVENSSYGATVCAERNAIFHSVAKFGKVDFDFIVVVCKPVSVPCALCLQVLSEFASEDMPVYLGDLEGVKKKHDFGKLLPFPFCI